MKRDCYTTDKPMDWQDRVVLKACAFVAVAFCWFIFVHWI